MTGWVKFLLYTFALTWFVGIILVIPLAAIEGLLKLPEDSISNLAAKYGPTLGGFVTMYALQGRSGAWALLRKGLRWKVGIQYYLFALLVPIIIKLPALYLLNIDFTLNSWSPNILHASLSAFATHFFLGGGLGEEFGWRGTMLPLMKDEFKLFTTTLILAFFWALWHMPAFIFADKGTTEPIMAFLVVVVAASFIMSWLYFETRQSVLILAIFHAMINASGKIFAASTDVTTEQLQTYAFYWNEALILLVLAVIILVLSLNQFLTLTNSTKT